ncbi:hypothetical protein [Ectobacillus panaciterrae]|uniref:hypothetical protein n=1 Tax=Ectobacillus panaciterrae TaxID=363872 RepID=UPI00048E5660|nr:hypothetical protein [Ectobacillus panaciterrae]
MPVPVIYIALAIALTLELFFFSIFFTSQLAKMPVIAGFILCLIISVLSLFISLYALVKHSPKFVAALSFIIAMVILFFTVWAYLIPEAGIPAPIQLW